MPLVSVIVPTHNRPQFLRDALESVVQQKFSDFEVLVVDDGSQPPAQPIVESLADPRLRYFYQDQRGRSHARNLGLRHAEGEFIALLDDDDWFLEDKLALQVDYLRANPSVELVAGGVNNADELGRLTELEKGWLRQPNLRLPEALYSLPLLPSAVLFRRRLLSALETWFDSRATPAEDTDFFLRALAAGCCFEWQPEIVAVRRLHPGNSQQDRRAYAEAYGYVFEKFFASARLPPYLVGRRNEVLGHYALISAMEAYQAGYMQMGASELLRALELSDWRNKDGARLLARAIASYATTKVSDDGAAFVDRVFDNLPGADDKLVGGRRHAQSAIYMDKVMKAVAQGKQPALKDWLRAVWIDPTWLTEKFSWAALLKAWGR
ncbi:MAG: glycosyltransferase family A protein [Candidatus Promineifilaceae bacterium]|nr:glycosyltransferase family A protein [Candidatus Promineifilaceae bacterium]